uniref:Uncharacterized protein n=1 Tax=Fagus sylvatica TaxID=28930 RepID=A0A2N9IES9_FAGSY
MSSLNFFGLSSPLNTIVPSSTASEFVPFFFSLSPPFPLTAPIMLRGKYFKTGKGKTSLRYALKDRTPGDDPEAAIKRLKTFGYDNGD